jgi:hypothetical protein
MELRFQDPAFQNNEITLKFLRSGKVVAKIGNGRSHYTLHPGTATQVIDLHRTDESYPEGRSCKARKIVVPPSEHFDRAIEQSRAIAVARSLDVVASASTWLDDPPRIGDRTTAPGWR